MALSSKVSSKVERESKQTRPPLPSGQWQHSILTNGRLFEYCTGAHLPESMLKGTGACVFLDSDKQAPVSLYIGSSLG